ncbi:MAG: phosphopyruvate hydratase [Candidatus Staskawiczbacteria bacterium RIFCSPLOWO2_01_FULL_37_25b]|uniref:Enolase n=1 Tax=Candidatus Staskawiczbacteria bacterium RIFCSPLOWO2_01_FULL_37_25b TaxID=1802213 RepID=A0A1G2ID84_9BACT|nr:MAG: phosphopyruvate hydratase [Candidatus Staskawiczbacteria bacterium RIFCSPLOWO2_01_FULL_37_25b]
MSKIKSIIAKGIKDSRGNPTLEVELETDKGVFSASVPSGASTGENEALELRDEDGKGVKTAISNVNNIIAPKLKNLDPQNQLEIDNIMNGLDGTENKSKLGANAILGVSMAVCRAGADVQKFPLYKYISGLAEVMGPLSIPSPMFNILNGGAHAKNDLDIQEFMIVPQKHTFTENLVLCNKIFQNLKDIIEKNYGPGQLGDEGGFAPLISKTDQALFLLKSSIRADDSKIALDCAASEFYKNGKYNLDDRGLTRAELLEFYKDLTERFPIISIEDPYSEEDWPGFEEISKQLGQKILIVGDDLTATNIKKIKEAHNKSACNGVILKLNQIGTVSETIEASNLAKSFGWKTIVSHRSGETMDDFIADFSVGAGADFIKSGSPAKEERMVKYKRLLDIEGEINKNFK